jgi:beta-lactamase regulating signal transducer with metallopeptidase domain
MTAIEHSFSSALLHFLWQGVAVAFLLWIGLYLLRKRSAASRYAACCAALALMALLPAVTTWLTYDPPAVAAPLAVAKPATPQAALAASPVRIPTLWIATLETWVLPVWSIGVLLLSFRLVWGCLQISRMRRRGALPDETLRSLVATLAQRLGIRQAVGVLIASDEAGPSVVGWIRPVVLVPASALLGLTPDQLEAVLAHELAHIRRHDYLVNILQVIVETLLFYHPAVWWVSARMRHERELCCDDLAVGCCGDAVCYARALTKLERLRITAPAMAMGSNSGSMLYRVQRLLGGAQEYVPSKLPGILALALGLVCFGLNIHSAHSQEPKPRQFWLRVSPGNDAGVTVDLGGATLAHQEGRIEYPGFARERGIDGTVTAELTLNGEAAVIDARVVSGLPELRKYVLQGVLNWRFTQAYANAVLYIDVKFDHAAAALAPADQEQRGYAVTLRGGALPVTGPAELTPEQNAERQRAMAELGAKIAELKRRNQGQLPEAMQAELGAAQANAEINRERERVLLLQQQQKLQAQAELEHSGQQPNGPLQEDGGFQRQRIRQVEGEIVDLENKLASAGADGAEQPRRQLQERRGELLQLQMALESAGGMTVESLAGRRLKSIHIFGQVEAGVLTQLGVAVGDTLTPESMAAAASTARQIDPRLEVQFLPTENSEAEMRIIGPGGAK